MASKTIAGTTVDVNDEGFLTNPAEWNKDIAVEIAQEEGIPAAHRRGLEGYRVRVAGRRRSGSAPTLRRITTDAGVTTKELFRCSRKDRRRRSSASPGWASRKAASARWRDVQRTSEVRCRPD